MLRHVRVLRLLALLAVTSCNEGGNPQGHDGGSVGRPIFRDDSRPDPTMPPAPQPNKAGSGTMTAGAFDDNLNFAAYQSFVAKYVAEKPELAALTPSAARQASEPVTKSAIDILFALDVTGSMGDELKYLNSELANIVSSFAVGDGQVAHRLGLIAFRDLDQGHLAASVPFTESLQAIQVALTALHAGGGGDQPEDMEVALENAAKMSWSQESSAAKVLFLITDAPPHADRMGRALQAAVALRDLDVVIYPVAASGAGDWAEFALRTMAAQTGGEYMFVTDDSGIGNDHADPHLPCYKVTTLREQIQRALASALKSERQEPDSTSVIREVGKGAKGVCALP